MIDQMLADKALWVFIGLRVFIWWLLESPLEDGYHVLDVNTPRKWEETHLILMSLAEAYILSWLIGISPIQSGNQIVPYLRVDLWTATFALFVGARWFYPWFKTLQDTDTKSVGGILRLSAYWVCILFGTGFGITSVIALHPDAATLQFLYQRQINFAIHVLQSFQAILGLQIAVLSPMFSHMWDIFKNNGMLALKSAGLGATGGLVLGLGIPLFMVMGMNAALLFGVFTGLLIRNSILAGSPMFAPFIAYFSSMGLLIIGHTFHEFMSFILMGVGAGMVTLGLVKTRSATSEAGLITTALGAGQLGYAAFVEVFLDPLFINFVKGFLTIEPAISPIPIKLNWAVGLSSYVVATTGLVLVTAWMIRVTTRTLEGQV